MIIRLIEKPHFINDTKEIFFNSSTKQSFTTVEEKSKFSYKYFDYYLENYPDLFFIYVYDNQVLGYICGSQNIDSTLLQIQPHMEVFSDSFQNFPAHLHINFSTLARGKGLGSILLNHFVSRLNVPGVHIITGPKERNVSFYEKNGFLLKEEKLYQSTLLLLMGKSLT